VIYAERHKPCRECEFFDSSESTCRQTNAKVCPEAGQRCSWFLLNADVAKEKFACLLGIPAVLIGLMILGAGR
jgi:hypothetical protein